jgi:hypothetical protein
MRHLRWLVFLLAIAATPPPLTTTVQRQVGVTINTAPVVNQKGTAGAPVSFTTAVEVIQSKPGRYAYWMMFETNDVRCEYGDVNNNAPTTTPTTTVGFLYLHNVLIYEHDVAQNSLWCIPISGTALLDSGEIIP